MSDLRTFDTPLKIYEYVNANYFRKLGCGVEGAAYLAKDGSVMKYIQLPSGVVKYNEDIITTSKFKLKSFIFPDELFVCDNLIYGYRTEYFSNDVLCDKYRRSIRIIDLEKLLEAREVKIDDIKVLTDAPAQIVKLLVSTSDGLKFILYQLKDTKHPYKINSKIKLKVYKDKFLIPKDKKYYF